MDKLMYKTEKTELISVPTPIQTSTYKPIPHKQLIDITLESINKAGFVLSGEKYTSARNGKQANARYMISSLQDSDMQLMIGWQNSYDKSLSLKFAIGTEIFICSNGSVRGDMGTFKKKHTGSIQEFTPQNIPEFIKRAEETFGKMQVDRDKWKEIEVSKRVSAELLGRMFIDDAIITSTQFGIIKGQIEAPLFDYGVKNSMWELYNHCTFAAKNSHPSDYFKTHMNIYNFFEKYEDNIQSF